MSEFIAACPTSFHTADRIRRHLEGLGFEHLTLAEPFPARPGRYVLTQDGAVAAWIQGEGISAPRFSVIATHTDSPTLKVKPVPSFNSPDGFNQLSVETYGGLLPNSWLNRDLGVAGRVVDAEGGVHLVRLDDFCTIPQLAVHLDRDTARELKLDRQRHLRPVWGVGEKRDFVEVLSQAVGVDVIAHELFLFDMASPRFVGVAEDPFLSGGRQDNLASTFSALQAMSELAQRAEVKLPPQTVPVFIAFDHEEIGSGSTTGAAGPLLGNLLRRISANLGASGAEFDQVMANSICLSCDVAHSVHPNYAEKHDRRHHPVLGGGPVLKLNANQRYATDAISAATFVRACRAAGVECQQFVSNNKVPCGSTIGPLTATRLGMRTVDVGTPILSMHAARELSLVRDHADMTAAMSAWWKLA